MPLVDRNLVLANQVMYESAQAINASAKSNARFMLWIALTASLLGVFFCLLITRKIVHPIGRIATDSSSNIQASNSVVSQLFGYDVDEIIQKPIKQLIPNFPLQNSQDHISNGHEPAISTEVDTRIELMGINKDGEQVPLWLIVNEIELGNRRMLTGLVIDITARKEAEITLREAIDHKNELQTIMSHEIRTLLNDITQSAEKLQHLRNHREKHRYVEMINEQG
jgi:PAS domain S-box-containing protein